MISNMKSAAGMEISHRKRIVHCRPRCSWKRYAYQGFLLDVTERRQAEQEIRRRNRELVVLNSLRRKLSFPL